MLQKQNQNPYFSELFLLHYWVWETEKGNLNASIMKFSGYFSSLMGQQTDI